MSKYRVFVPAVSVTRDFNDGKFGFLKADGDGNWLKQHGSFDTVEAVQEAAEASGDLTAIAKFGAPNISASTYVGTHYSSYSQARDRADELESRYKEQDGVIATSSTVETVIIDTEDEEEYRPDYSVTMMVTITKRIEVHVDGSECDDESDAEEEAIRMFHDGELDSDIECEYEYDRDYEIECVEEDA